MLKDENWTFNPSGRSDVDPDSCLQTKKPRDLDRGALGKFIQAAVLRSSARCTQTRKGQAKRRKSKGLLHVRVI
jgi:hypothetical protein